MSEKRKLEILIDILGSFTPAGQECLFFCPKCSHHKRKLSINLTKDKFKCWVCDYAGRSVRRLVRRWGGYSQLDEWNRFEDKPDILLFDGLFEQKEIDKNQRVELPKEFETLTKKNIPSSARPARKYLQNRGISQDDIVRWKIGYCISGQYAKRIIIPSFGEDGYLNYFVARTYSGDWKKYDQPAVSRNMIFNHLYIDWDSDLTIVEGVFDAFVAGPNAVPILGSTLQENSRLLQEVVQNDTPVYIALDADAEKKAQKLIKQLLEHDVELYKVDISPFDDVGEMTESEFNERKTQATFIDQDNYLFYCATCEI